MVDFSIKMRYYIIDHKKTTMLLYRGTSYDVKYRKKVVGEIRKKNVTIYDVADKAGVSASMVSRVISGKGAVSENNRVRIKKLLEELDFKPNAVARGLQQQHSNMIGFLLPHIGNQYFSSVYYEFEKNASEHGFLTILFNGKSDYGTELKLLRIMEEARVEAIVIMGGSADARDIPEEYLKEVKRINQSIPCIICGEQAEKFGCIGVHADSKSTQKIVKHLKEQDYKSMGIIGGANSTYPSYIKKQILQEAAEQFQLELKEEWIKGNSFDVLDGIEAMESLLKEKRIPEAICCINDHVAVGVINTAISHGLKVPEDIAVTGYDGVEVSTIIKPSITTMQHDYEEYGRKIYEAVEALMTGKTYQLMNYISTNLIIRESTIKNNK